MFSKSKLAAIGVSLSLLGLGACASPYAGDTYYGNEMRYAQRVQAGTVISTRLVNLRNEANGLITTGVGALGGMAGSHLGKGSGNVAGAIAGALVAGVIADKVQQYTSQAQEVTFQLDSGEVMSIAQTGPAFSVGQRIKVVGYGRDARLLPL